MQAATAALIDEKAIYDVFKDILKDKKGRDCSKEEIRAHINARSQSSGILQRVLRVRGVDGVCTATRTLLLDDIFASPKKARKRFAGLPAVNLINKVGTAAEEPTALILAANFADNPQEPSQPQGQQLKHTAAPVGNLLLEEQNTPNTVTTTALTESSTIRGTSAGPELSTSPSHLPYSAQYRLMVETQRSLEQACFRFAQANAPGILKQNEWDCPEALELNAFLQKLKARQQHGPSLKSRGPLTDARIGELSDIRHAAVHRLRLSASDMDRKLRYAEDFLVWLDDTSCQKQIRQLRRSAQDLLANLDRKEQEAGGKRAATMAKFQVQRNELRKQEDAALQKLEQEKGRHLDQAAAALIDAVQETCVKGSGKQRDHALLALVTGLTTLMWKHLWNGMGRLLKRDSATEQKHGN